MAGSVQDQRLRAAAAALRHRMVRHIVAGGGLTDPAWRAAFAAVPRHLFVPVYFCGDSGDPGHGRYAADDPDARRRLRWLKGAYTDQPIATHVTGGELVSSSSQPSLMALMCEALDVHEGQRVLEIGAGTGYNAALLAHRLGGTGAVTTVDLDAAITAAAREHLAAYGTAEALAVTVVTGDGALGHPPGAPYDRVVATCELRRSSRPGPSSAVPARGSWRRSRTVSCCSPCWGRAGPRGASCRRPRTSCRCAARGPVSGRPRWATTPRCGNGARRAAASG